MRQGIGRWHLGGCVPTSPRHQFERRLGLHTYSYSCRHNNTSTKHLQLQLCCQATAHTQEIKHPNPTTKPKLEGFGCPYSNLSVSSFYSLWCLNSCQSSPLIKHNKEQCLERCQTDIELVAPCGMHLPLRAGEQVTRQCFTRSKKSCQTTTSITSLALNPLFIGQLNKKIMNN